MLAVIDYRTNSKTIEKLLEYVDDIYLFKTGGITFNSISGHPDIFVYQDNNNLILAPNSPSSLFDIFNRLNVGYSIGNKIVGSTFESSVTYNCLSTEEFLFHKKGLTDKTILDINGHKKFIDLNQAYARCSLIHLKEEKFITSDRGIEKILIEDNLQCFYFEPSDIQIVDHKNGFVGGTAGVIGNRIFFNGDIDLHTDGKDLRSYIENLGFEIICLGKHKLYDGGGIFFI